MEKAKAEEELKQASGSASDMSVQLKNVTAKLQDTEKELSIFKVSTVRVFTLQYCTFHLRNGYHFRLELDFGWN